MCDTFVAVSSATAHGSVIFGKNSDREPNEAQVLEYHPARAWRQGERVQCTHLEIPQVKATRAVLLSRPFWMWGAEMGANEKGLVIGNEAVWSKMPLSKKGGLTGMDLQRLALERSESAEKGVETIVRLLADHGQGGVCGYEDKRLVYHNSFILADPEGAWVLETAGPLWAALKVKGIYSISNGLTIGEDFDEHHPDLIDTAWKKGWLKKGEDFHFARCFSDWFYTTFSASRRRRERCHSLLKEQEGDIDLSSAFGFLRDHGAEDYRPDRHFLCTRLCAHSANKLTRNASQSTGSLVAHLKKNVQTYWATGTSAPCTGVFKPIWFGGEVLPDTGPTPVGTFNPQTLWWRHEELHRSVMLDYGPRISTYSQERDRLEMSFLKNAYGMAAHSRWDLTQSAFKKAWEATETWTDRVQARPLRQESKWIYRRYWERQNNKAGIRVR